MSRSDDCMGHAEYCEKMARRTGLDAEREELLSLAQKWRRLAMRFEDVARRLDRRED